MRRIKRLFCFNLSKGSGTEIPTLLAEGRASGPRSFFIIQDIKKENPLEGKGFQKPPRGNKTIEFIY
jgi:hypothetical protein